MRASVFHFMPYLYGSVRFHGVNVCPSGERNHKHPTQPDSSTSQWLLHDQFCVAFPSAGCALCQGKELSCSTWDSGTSGIYTNKLPQGRVLSPTLSLANINDVVPVRVYTSSFADVEECSSIANNRMQQVLVLEEWSRTWLINVGEVITTYTVFSLSNKFQSSHSTKDIII